MSERTAVVVGAGIGGVTAAAALGQLGWRVTLLERAPELGEVGAGISVWPNAIKVLDGLGATKYLGDAGIDAIQGGLRRPDGKWLVRVSGAVMEAPMMVHRARLHDAITATFGPTVETRTGVTVARVAQTPYAATVVSEAGRSSRQTWWSRPTACAVSSVRRSTPRIPARATWLHRLPAASPRSIARTTG